MNHSRSPRRAGWRRIVGPVVALTVALVGIAAPAQAVTISPADTAKVAWVSTSPDAPAPDPVPYTLQQALDAAVDGNEYVHVIEGDLAFGKALTVRNSVTLVSAARTSISALWTIASDYVTFTGTSNVHLTGTAAAGKTIITVAKDTQGVTIENIELTTGAATQSGVGLNGTADATLSNFTFSAPLDDATYGITARNAATGVTVNRADISGVNVGFYMGSSDTAATGAHFTDVTVSARTAGFQMGSSESPRFERVTVSNPDVGAKNSAAIDLAKSSGATVHHVNLSGFEQGVKGAATSGTGAQITDSAINANLTGISLGATDSPSVTGVSLTGGTPGGTNSFGIDAGATNVELHTITIDGFPIGYRNTVKEGVGTSASSIKITGATHGGMNLGTATGSSLTNVSIDLAGQAPAGTGTTALALNNSQGLTVRDLQVVGYPTGITTGSTDGAGPYKLPITIENATLRDVKSGISLNNVANAALRNITVTTNTPGGNGVYLRWVDGTTIDGLNVAGTAGSSYAIGTNGIRSYYSENHTLTNIVISGGSTGFYFDTTEGVESSHIEISGMTWYGVYTEQITDWTMTDAHFHDNNAIGNLTHDPQYGLSANVHWTGSTFTNHRAGVYLPLGISGFRLDNSTVVMEGGRYVFMLAPAHDVLVDNNDITFTPLDDTSAAMIIGNDNYANRDNPDDYTSSNVHITDNVFGGSGPFVRAGSTGGKTTALSDTVLVRGNVFPADSRAIVALPHAGGAADGVAVDARDGDDPNDWGTPCGPVVTITDTSEVEYDGGGAGIDQQASGQVLYPTRCTAPDGGDDGLTSPGTSDGANEPTDPGTGEPAEPAESGTATPAPGATNDRPGKSTGGSTAGADSGRDGSHGSSPVVVPPALKPRLPKITVAG